MPNSPFAVPTINSIKRHAKVIKKTKGIQLARAQDEAAVAAGFQNFRHAQNRLPVASPPSSHPLIAPGNSLLLNVVWSDLESSTHGKESLVVMLSQPLGHIICKTSFNRNRNLSGFKSDGLNQLTMWLRSSQDRAQVMLCKAARTFAFMDATGLRPSAGFSRAYPTGEHRVPHEDHASVWYHPTSKCYVIASEPYEAAMKGNEVEVLAWCTQHGYTVCKPNWPGMYNPQVDDVGGSRLYLFSRVAQGAPVNEMATALNALPFPVAQSTLEQAMQAFDLSKFQRSSDVAQKLKAIKPPKPVNATTAAPVSVGVHMFMSSSQQRPNARMPVPAHQEVGRMLKSVLQVSYYRKGVYNRINSIRCELDDWVQAEYPSEELSMEVFVDLYYQEGASNYIKAMTTKERNKHVSSLHSIQAILSRHYPDSSPLRSILKKLDAAVASLRAWE